jgi:hypothetical protein
LDKIGKTRYSLVRGTAETLATPASATRIVNASESFSRNSRTTADEEGPSPAFTTTWMMDVAWRLVAEENVTCNLSVAMDMISERFPIMLLDKEINCSTVADEVITKVTST